LGTDTIYISITRQIMSRQIAVLLLFSVFPLLSQEKPPPEQKSPVEQKAAEPLREFSTAMEALTKRVSRSVVQVFSTGYSLNTEDTDTTSTSLITRQRSTASGAILSPEGHIITNAHVVQGARRVQVRLSYPLPAKDGHPRRELLDAQVVGVDREADLAVIKIALTGLDHLALGNSDALHQGQVVLAMGNPLGLENSVSMGVISSVGRQLKPDDPMSYIQTDASINPGNSGGPLLDTEAHVIGINTLIYSQSGGNEGIGFAIPSNLVRSVYTQIKANGHVHRGQIGVSVQSVTPALADGLRLPKDYGVLVADVEPGGPSATAGLSVRDIIVAINGRAIDNASQLERDLYRRPLGEKIILQVLRGDDKLDLSVTVSEREGDPQRFADLVTPENNAVARLGILGFAIDKKTAAMLPDLRKPYGILVAARSSSPPYSGSGVLQQGDVIYEINREPISTIEALRKTIDAIKPGDPCVLQIERDSKLMYLSLELQ
jgi:serine protease Do